MDQYLFGKDLYQRKAASLLLNCIFLQEGRTLTALALQKGLCSASNDEELSSVLLLIKDVEMWMPEVRIRDETKFIDFLFLGSNSIILGYFFIVFLGFVIF